MLITGLFHIAVKTNNLDETVAFYTQVLGLQTVHRPDFGFPGAWIGVPTPLGQAIIHLYGGGPALGADGRAPVGTGAIDHVAITAVGWDDCIAKLEKAGCDWRAALVPGTPMWQIFAYDPNGVLFEITFDGRAENRATPEIAPERVYQPGVSFFKRRPASLAAAE
jgi:catechol 2,3-dioxygenase-like lactoylglutathione lyase family enzyme